MKITRTHITIPIVGALVVGLLGAGVAAAAFTKSQAATQKVTAGTVLTGPAASASISNTTATITWTLSAKLAGGRDVTSHQVERTQVSGGAKTLLACTSSPCTDSGLTAGQSYTYAVRGKYQQWTGPYGTSSGSVTATAAPTVTITMNVGTGTGHRNVFSGTSTQKTSGGSMVVKVYSGTTTTGTPVKTYTLATSAFTNASSPFNWSITTGNQDLSGQVTAVAQQLDSSGNVISNTVTSSAFTAA